MADTFEDNDVAEEMDSLSISARGVFSSDDHGASGHDDALPVGPSIGRYVVVEEIGAGGMGRVYRAYDPKLRREVAIKLLRRSGDAEADVRLLREAQGMAQIAHPNVVPVYDVERGPHGIFIVMEFVRGQTLLAWLKQEKRPWREIVTMFVAAGRGLHAAHQRGIVHLDFKPSNVLVDQSGRPRVLDFGLSRVSASFSDDASVSMELSHSGIGSPWPPPEIRTTGEEVNSSDGHTLTDLSLAGSALGERLTRDGKIMGTPAYMAPERFDRAAPHPQADQYAFCVALYEALYRRRPYGGSRLGEQVDAKRTGKLRPPSKGSDVPRALFSMVERGLSPSPGDRWYDLETLVRELERTVDARRRRWTAVAAVALTSVAAGVGAFTLFESPSPTCDATGPTMAQSWNEERSRELAARFAASSVPVAAETWTHASTALDDYAARWGEVASETCELASSKAVSEVAATQSRACLDGGRAEVEALTKLWRGGQGAGVEAEVVHQAMRAVQGLPDPTQCRPQLMMLRSVAPPSAADRERVEVLSQRLSQLRAIGRAGASRRALEGLELIGEEAASVGHAPLEARIAVAEGTIETEVADFDAAESSLKRGYFQAVEARDFETAYSAATSLMSLMGTERADARAAHEWEAHAKAMIELAPEGSVDGLRLAKVRASTLQSDGKYVEALEAFEQVRTLIDMTHGSTSVEAAEAIARVGTMKGLLGRHAEAIADLTEALTLSRELLGATHPEVASTLNNLGLNHDATGDLDRALECYAQAREILVDAYGPQHPGVATSWLNAAVIHHRRNDYGAALKDYDAALEIYEAIYEPGHPSRLHALMNRGALIVTAGRPQEGITTYRTALADGEAVLPASHPILTDLRGNLADALEATGDLEAALAEQRRTLAAREAHLGASHPDVALSLFAVGRVELALGEVESAERDTRAALRVWHTLASNEVSLDQLRARTQLGQVQLAQGNPEGARATLESVANAYADMTDPPDGELEALTSLLAEATTAVAQR